MANRGALLRFSDLRPLARLTNSIDCAILRERRSPPQWYRVCSASFFQLAEELLLTSSPLLFSALADTSRSRLDFQMLAMPQFQHQQIPDEFAIILSVDFPMLAYHLLDES